MAVSYGTNVYFDGVRTAVATELAALIAQMTTDATSPTFAAAYSHHDTVPMSFNAVSIGIEAVDIETPGQYATGAGAVVEYLFNVDLRVMVGYRHVYPNEVAVMQLCQSIVNWFEVHRGSIGSAPYRLHGNPRVAGTRLVFEDTDTRGGLIEMQISAFEGYTAA